jgi:hypothetical protein
MFPWLSQHHVRLHAAQNCVMCKKTVMNFFTSVEALAQNQQVTKSIKSKVGCLGTRRNTSRKGFRYRGMTLSKREKQR